MSQTLTSPKPASPAQANLIQTLYRKVNGQPDEAVLDLPEDLTSLQASQIIDQFKLRQVSQELRRPVEVDLTDPVAVKAALAKLSPSKHSALRVPRVSNGEKPKRAAISNMDPAARRRVLASMGVTVRQVEPEPRRKITVAQEKDARSAFAARNPEVYGTGRYTESTGYGAHASYSVQRSNQLGEQSEMPAITDTQERAVIELQEQTGDTAIASTVTEAAAYLDEAFKPSEPKPTQRQLDYLHSLETKAGVAKDKLSHPATRQAASRRIERLRAQIAA